MSYLQHPEEARTAFAVAVSDVHFKACERVHDFIAAKVEPLIKRELAQPSVERETYALTLLRVQSWLGSLQRLNRAGDYQAMAAAARATFETAVDLTLLSCNGKVDTFEKLLAFERSSKLKAAERSLRHYESGKTPAWTPISARGSNWPAMISGFVKREGVSIRADRAKHWPDKNGKGRHPPRWTGFDLAHDAGRADSFDNRGFGALYDTGYDRLCWNVHGSGVTSVRKLREEHFPVMAADSLEMVARLAVISARATLVLFGKWEAIVECRFEQLEGELDAEQRELMREAGARLLLSRSST